jgi:hypothetical protein
VCAKLLPTLCNKSAFWKNNCKSLAPMFCKAQAYDKKLYAYCLKVAKPYTG